MKTSAQAEGKQLQEWANENKPADDLIYKNGYWDQIMFVRDVVTPLLLWGGNYDEYKALEQNTRVISTHRSKSVILPVFLIEMPDGTRFTLRYNFYNWKVSVDSPKDVEADFLGLFDQNAQVHPVYCEGFDPKWVYGAYATNKRQFTIELPAGNYHLFTFFWIFAKKILGKV